MPEAENRNSTQVPTIREVAFHGARLLVRPGDGPDTTMVAMKPIVEGMGLDWGGQHKKLLKHPILAQGVSNMEIPSAGGLQEATALPLNRLPFWLATLHPNKISDAVIREKVIIYQTEAADALFERFFGPAIHSPVNSGKIGRQVAAIVQEKLNNALTLILPAMVREQIGSRQHAVVDGVSAGQVIEMAGVEQRKGLRGLPVWVSHRLRRFHSKKGAAVHIATLGSRSAFVFDPLIAREWLATGGKVQIEQKVAEYRGQGRFTLVRS